MTRNEVDLHRAQHPHNMLIVLCSIALDRTATPPLASQGVTRVVSPWLIDDAALTPLGYRYTV